MQVNFYEIGEVDERELAYAVIQTRYQGKWLFVQHRERATWEIPGGHREEGESIMEAAKRELFEETGALEYSLHAVCDYSVNSYGRLFLADVTKLGPLPDSEITQIQLFDDLPTELTYPKIQPYLFHRVQKELTEEVTVVTEENAE